MNKKLIIAAVSAAIVAPVVSYADTTAFGRARGIIQSVDSKSVDSKTDIQSDIRLGLKASSELDNGLTTHARVEVDFNPDTGGGELNSVRVAQAGFSGPFGNVQIGKMWSAYYNNVGGMVSLSNHGSFGAAFLRTSNTIQYSNSFGPVSLAIDARFNDGQDSNSKSESGWGVGLTLNPIASLTIGIATDTAKGAPATKGSPHKYVNLDGTDAKIGGTSANKDDPADFNPILHRTTVNPVTAKPKGDDTKNTGLAIKYALGNGLFGTIGALQKKVGSEKEDKQFLWVGGPIAAETHWLLGTYNSEVDGSNLKNKGTTWNIKHSIGGGLGVYYEGQNYKQKYKLAASGINGAKNEKSVDTHTVGMVFNF